MTTAHVGRADGSGIAWIGRVDFRDAELPFILEVQSELHHTSRIDTQLDETRVQRLKAAGFVVVEVTDVEVWYEPQVLVRKVIEGRREAKAKHALQST